MPSLHSPGTNSVQSSFSALSRPDHRNNMPSLHSPGTNSVQSSFSALSRPDHRLILPQSPCHRCRVPFALNEPHLLVANTFWHIQCFRCAQCFEALEEDEYFEEGGRLYCHHDFNVLFAPKCAHCKKFVMGQVFRTPNGNFHRDCFLCEDCGGHLDDGLWYHDGRRLCIECKAKIPRKAEYICDKCYQKIDENELLRYKQGHFHAYHFDCTVCGEILTQAAREKNGELLCVRCYDLQCEVCFGCKHVIDPQIERSILALGKHWHTSHFQCVSCGSSLEGKEHFEKNGNVYCSEDFALKFGSRCHTCGKGITGVSMKIFAKDWCPGCYRCFVCNQLLRLKDKVAEVDMRPMCKRCFKSKNYRKAMELKRKEFQAIGR